MGGYVILWGLFYVILLQYLNEREDFFPQNLQFDSPSYN